MLGDVALAPPLALWRHTPSMPRGPGGGAAGVSHGWYRARVDSPLAAKKTWRGQQAVSNAQAHRANALSPAPAWRHFGGVTPEVVEGYHARRDAFFAVTAARYMLAHSAALQIAYFWHGAKLPVRYIFALPQPAAIILGAAYIIQLTHIVNALPMVLSSTPLNRRCFNAAVIDATPAWRRSYSRRHLLLRILFAMVSRRRRHGGVTTHRGGHGHRRFLFVEPRQRKNVTKHSSNRLTHTRCVTLIPDLPALMHAPHTCAGCLPSA